MQLLTIYGTKVQSQQLVNIWSFVPKVMQIVLSQNATFFDDFQTLWLKMRLFLGGAVDMFYRYGFFSLSVRVVPRDDPGKWLVREPTANIFDQQSLVIEDKAGPNTFARQPVQVSIF